MEPEYDHGEDADAVEPAARFSAAGCLLGGAAALGIPALILASFICSILVGLQHRDASPFTGGCMVYWWWLPAAGVVLGLGLGGATHWIFARSGPEALRQPAVALVLILVAVLGLFALLRVLSYLPVAWPV